MPGRGVERHAGSREFLAQDRVIWGPRSSGRLAGFGIPHVMRWNLERTGAHQVRIAHLLGRLQVAW